MHTKIRMQNIRVANGHTKKLPKDVPKAHKKAAKRCAKGQKRKSSDAKTANQSHSPGSNPDLLAARQPLCHWDKKLKSGATWF